MVSEKITFSLGFLFQVFYFELLIIGSMQGRVVAQVACILIPTVFLVKLFLLDTTQCAPMP